MLWGGGGRGDERKKREKKKKERERKKRTDLARWPAHAGRVRIDAVHDELPASADVVDRVLEDLGRAGRFDDDVEAWEVPINGQSAFQSWPANQR